MLKLMNNSLNSEKTENNRLGTMPIGRLIVYMSVPTMFSMLIQALYNIVDSIFVSHYSELALTAVSLAFPLQTLMISFAVGMSVGICSVISRRLGAGKPEEAFRAGETGYIIQLCLTAVFIAVGLFLSRPFLGLYTNDAELLELSATYACICLGIGIGVFISVFCEKTIQATGDTFHPMVIQAAGAIVNIILDPILIFGYLGLPSMGVAGAAYATVAGQLFSMCLGLFFLRRNRYVSISLLHPRWSRKSASDIFSVGFPAVVMQGIGTIMTSLMNGILISFNVLATTVFGVYFKLQSFVFMPVFGMNSGLMPILGFNYGAQNRARMLKTLRLGLVFAFLFMTAGSLVFITVPDALLGLFNASPAMMAIGEVALRRIAVTFPLAAISILLGALFQAIGDGYLSMIVSIVRQVFILIPCAWLLGRLYGLDAVWFSFLVAEIVALTMSLLFYRKELKKLDFAGQY